MPKDRKLKNCPFCGADIYMTPQRELYGWHKNNCFLLFLKKQYMPEYETEDELLDAYIEAWQRRCD